MSRLYQTNKARIRGILPHENSPLMVTNAFAFGRASWPEDYSTIDPEAVEGLDVPCYDTGDMEVPFGFCEGK